MSNKISKILIPNRGEIAVRIIRACREMGITSVAVYSEADRNSRHVFEADEAVYIGPPPPLESYLNIENILDAAKTTGADAVHPGYGFLSENAEFARQCVENGLTFIGPSPEAMEMVGDKLTARTTMSAAGVPLTPGVELENINLEQLKEHATRIGFPVMIKAAAGGGGKGMRVVHEIDEIQGALEASQREAKSAFGNDVVYLEKYIEKPRHIEFQVLADSHGNTVHLFERECSIQRRHQKIVEETPSPALSPELREQMGKTACTVMEAVDYVNAGTVEFLLDTDNSYYFLEVNARIQVEHPVTEEVTGVDLVKEQIRIANGATLSFSQADLSQRGHAIECRIYAEDPANNFLPSTGTLHRIHEPQGPGIRCDSGITQGMEITHFYDPILSKLTVHAETRDAAIQRMIAALNDYIVLGVKTPIGFLAELLDHSAFRNGELHTGFLAEHFAEWSDSPEQKLEDLASILAVMSPRTRQVHAQSTESSTNPWTELGRWDMLSE